MPHSQLLTPGQQHFGFTLDRITEIPELKCILRELSHTATGAQVVHIENDDPENLFCLSFQTLPTTSNGVAHILEHTVLCGSQNFPIKDPFFAMTRRSLNTFMNALTGADFTCYPAASQVPRDFYNLLEVYLDAVFRPNLHRLSFLQEGCRLEFEQPSDPNTPLQYKGIVFNEMKGALSSPSARLFETINSALFPQITYGINSGGDPRVIPSLQYQELLDFYKTYYHPSRCLFFFYGNLPLGSHLDFLARHCFEGVVRMPPLPSIPLQPRFKAPVVRTLPYPVSAETTESESSLIPKGILSFAWLTCCIKEQETLLALLVLEILLLDNDASPLKKALLQSGLCTQVSSFMDGEMHEIPWGIILKGVDPEHAPALEQLLFESLQKIASEGIELTQIEAALHQLEFHRTEITGDHSPFGLTLFMRSGLLKQHGLPPADGMVVHTLFDHLRQRSLADPHLFSHLIQTWLLDNPHRVSVVMKPDPHLIAKEQEQEKQLLESIKSRLSTQEQADITRTAAELVEFREQQELVDHSVLPNLSLEDIPHCPKQYSLHQSEHQGFSSYFHSTFTNQILYADWALSLPPLDDAEIPVLRLLTSLWAQMGTASHSYHTILDTIQSHTGGIDTYVSLGVNALHPHQASPRLYFRGKALHRKVDRLFPLMHELFHDLSFHDHKRLREVLLKHFTNLESRVTQNALKYALSLAGTSVSPIGELSERLYGLSYYQWLRTLISQMPRSLGTIAEQLTSLHSKLRTPPSADLILAGEPSIYDRLLGHNFYDAAPKINRGTFSWKPALSVRPSVSTAYAIGAPVCFIAQTMPTLAYSDARSPLPGLATHLFNRLVLHPKIREEGGAYGGGSAAQSLAGDLSFYSYRDPHIASTLSAFQQALHIVAEGQFTEEELLESKFEMVQELDTPLAPGARGRAAYEWMREGRTLPLRQQFRSNLLKATQQEVVALARDLLLPHFPLTKPVIFGAEQLIQQENARRHQEGEEPLQVLRP